MQREMFSIYKKFEQTKKSRQPMDYMIFYSHVHVEQYHWDFINQKGLTYCQSVPIYGNLLHQISAFNPHWKKECFI